MSRHGENVFKRRDGRWEARYVREISLDGRKKYGSVYAKTYREVKEKQRLLIEQPRQGSQNLHGKTLLQIMEEWLNSAKNQLKISTLQKYQSIIEKHLSQIGNLPIKFVTGEVISQFTDSLLEQLSRETVNQILIVLGMGLSYAKAQYNAVLPDIHLLKCAKPSVRVLSVTEQNILVNYLRSCGDIFAFGVLLALFTGMRVGEICALKWENISAETIRICATMQRLKSDLGKTEIVILPPKTECSNREIPIPKTLIFELENRRKSGGFVLQQTNGNPVEPRLLQSRFSRIAGACGLSDVHFHTLRHPYVKYKTKNILKKLKIFRNRTAA